MSNTASVFAQTLWSRAKGLSVAICAGVLTSACAGSDGIGELALLSSDTPPAPQETQLSGPDALMKATDYWRTAYQKKPTKKENALNYARNLKALGQKKQALAVLQHASSFHGTDKEVAGEYGRLALDLGQVDVAQRLLRLADDPTKPDWRVVAARGTVFAKKGQFNAALPFYQRALAMAPGQPSILNNIALAEMMNGNAKSAETMLRQAIAKGGPHAKKARQNLALALGVQGRYNESASIASSVMPRAHASSNADYLKKLVRLDEVRTPAPVPVPAAVRPRSQTAIAKAPLTPDQLIAQAQAASASYKQAGSTYRATKSAVQSARSATGKSNVVRTVAKAAASQAPAFKPASY